MLRKILALTIIVIILPPVYLRAGQGDEFVFAQLKFQGNWDPYPGAFEQMYYYLTNTTSISMLPERRVVELNDKDLFYSPFLVFTGKGSYPEFSSDELESLRRYVEGGGIIFIDTCGCEAFEASVNRTLSGVFPEEDNGFSKIPDDSAVFRAFYLVDYVAGRKMNAPYLEGMERGGRIAVIKSKNDLVGIWPRDRLENWEHELTPGRPDQRKEAVKLMLNIMIYSVSGTYKADPVHTPHIEEKLGR